MSFEALALEVVVEFAGLSGAWEYAPDGYSFRRLSELAPVRHPQHPSARRAVKASWMRRWRRANPERSRAIDRAYVERLKATDPERLRAMWRAKKRRQAAKKARP